MKNPFSTLLYEPSGEFEIFYYMLNMLWRICSLKMGWAWWTFKNIVHFHYSITFFTNQSNKKLKKKSKHKRIRKKPLKVTRTKGIYHKNTPHVISVVRLDGSVAWRSWSALAFFDSGSKPTPQGRRRDETRRDEINRSETRESAAVPRSGFHRRELQLLYKCYFI